MPADRDRLIGRLVAAGCVAAAEEADLLLDDHPDPTTLGERLVRREAGEPLAWIIGHVRFCGRRIRVDRGVYVPRPQTEELARRGAAVLPVGGRAVDLCCGSGAIAAHLAALDPTATTVATDLDRLAATCASGNDVPAVVCDLGTGLRGNAFDLVTVVAPYVPSGSIALLPEDSRRHEPIAALHGGPDGLDLVRRAAADALRLLVAGGWLLTEIGGDQDGLLADELAALGFVDITTWRDDEGDLRGIAARRP